MKVEGFSLDVNPTVEPAERNTLPGETTGAQPALDFLTWGMAYHLDVEPCGPARDRSVQRCADLEPPTDGDLDVLMIRTKRTRGHRRSMPPAPTALPAPACAPAQHARPAPPALPAPARAARAKVGRMPARDASTTTSPSLSQMEMAEPHRQRDWRYIQLGKSQRFVSLWVLLVVGVLGLVLLAGAIIVALWLMSH